MQTPSLHSFYKLLRQNKQKTMLIFLEALLSWLSEICLIIKPDSNIFVYIEYI